MINPEFDYTWESDGLKCPYCGQKNTDAWEIDFDDDKLEIECDCGKTFWGTRNTTINYEGKADCELNEQKHDLEPTHNKGQFECKICGQYIYKKKENAIQ